MQTCRKRISGGPEIDVLKLASEAISEEVKAVDPDISGNSLLQEALVRAEHIPAVDRDPVAQVRLDRPEALDGRVYFVQRLLDEQ